MSDEPTAEQLVAWAAEQGAQQQLEFQKNVADLIKHGHETHGTEAFDEARRAVDAALGPHSDEFAATVVEHNAPDQIIMHLAANENRLKKLATLPPAQRKVEISRIEAEYASHGHVSTSMTPAWKDSHSRGGRVSDADWKSNYGSNLTNDQWSKEWDRRHGGEGRR
jgi:predicted ester cyclase